jgi:peptide/nickel transport system permease protein/oligopeptide transport system permease protein
MNFFLKKILIVIPTLYVAWTVVFITLNIIPGDPVNLMLGGRPASDEVRENVRHNLGLDKPVGERYVSFLINATKGDLGKSYLTRQPVTRMIKDNMVPTIQLSLGGLIFGVFFGVLLGIIAGSRPNSLGDTFAMVVALCGISLPSFWIGMLLIFIFGTTLGWVPIVGEGFVSLILPSISVGLFFAGGMARLTRSSLIDVLNQDYIRTARSKGISKYRIIFKHALRNAMIPPVTLLGIQFGLLITGAVITEEVFARPGLGQLLLQAILAKDIPLVQALIVYITAVYIFLNLVVDFTYGIIDPRIRLERKAN